MLFFVVQPEQIVFLSEKDLKLKSYKCPREKDDNH